MGYKRGPFPCIYIGIELEKGSKYNKDLIMILEKLDARIGGWKDKWLTKARKITKIRAILSALPTYPLSYLPLSKHINKKFKAMLRNFSGMILMIQKN